MSEQYRISGNTATAITASIESGVRTRALRPDEQLPSVRGLAEALGVSPATVSAAYQQLRRRGIVSTAGRNGTRIRSAPPIATTRSSRALAVPDGVLDLASGEPDSDLLAAVAPALRSVAAQLAAGPGPVNYAAGGPLPQFVAAARERLAGLPDSASYTVVGGALDGIDRLLSVRLRPGDRVAVEDPGWPAMLDLLAAHGLTPVPVDLDEQGPTVAGMRAALAAGVSAVMVTTRAQNPTGASISASRARALRPLLRDTFLIEDDHAAELADFEMHPLAGAGSQWAFLRSASKSYGPDLRCAVLAGDDETISRVAGRMRLSAGWVSTVLQRTLLELWGSAQTDALLARARDSYGSRRAALIDALAGRGVPAFGSTGINVWIPVPDETRAVTLLRDAGYAVGPGHLHRVASPPAIRITISRLTEADIKPLADAVHRAVSGGHRTVAM